MSIVTFFEVLSAKKSSTCRLIFHFGDTIFVKLLVDCFLMHAFQWFDFSHAQRIDLFLSNTTFRLQTVIFLTVFLGNNCGKRANFN